MKEIFNGARGGGCRRALARDISRGCHWTEDHGNSVKKLLRRISGGWWRGSFSQSLSSRATVPLWIDDGDNKDEATDYRREIYHADQNDRPVRDRSILSIEVNDYEAKDNRGARQPGQPA